MDDLVGVVRCIGCEDEEPRREREATAEYQTPSMRVLYVDVDAPRSDYTGCKGDRRKSGGT